MGPKFPIGVTHDFHANVDPAIIANANVVITGKECPHLDTKERGQQTAEILARMIKGYDRNDAFAPPPPGAWLPMSSSAGPRAPYKVQLQ